MKLYVWKFILDNEKYIIRLKENEGESNIQIIINNQINEAKKELVINIEHKSHQFKFIKLKGENLYKFYIDSNCFDDLKSNKINKKGNENNILNHIITNNTFSKINYINKENNKSNCKDNQKDIINKRTGSDIYLSNLSYKDENQNNPIVYNLGYISNNKVSKKEKSEMDRKNFDSKNYNNNVYNNSPMNLYKIHVKESNIYYYNSEDMNYEDIPEYDNANEKIVNYNHIINK